MTWASAKAAVKAAIVSATELRAESISWQGKAVSAGGKKIILSIVAAPQESYDRVTQTPQESGQDLDVDTSATVVFTVGIRCEDISGDSIDLAELVRSGLALPSIKAALKAAGVVIVGYPMGPIPTPYEVDDRDVDAFTLDVKFRTVFGRTDVPVTTIEKVQGEGTLKDPPHADVTVPIDVAI